MSTKKSKIPPICLKPRFLLDEEQIDEPKNCFQYFEANYLLPMELFEIYNELVKRFHVKE